MRYAGGHRHPEKGNLLYQNQNRPFIINFGGNRTIRYTKIQIQKKLDGPVNEKQRNTTVVPEKHH